MTPCSTRPFDYLQQTSKRRQIAQLEANQGDVLKRLAYPPIHFLKSNFSLWLVAEANKSKTSGPTSISVTDDLGCMERIDCIISQNRLQENAVKRKIVLLWFSYLKRKKVSIYLLKRKPLYHLRHPQKKRKLLWEFARPFPKQGLWIYQKTSTPLEFKKKKKECVTKTKKIDLTRGSNPMTKICPSLENAQT